MHVRINIICGLLNTVCIWYLEIMLHSVSHVLPQDIGQQNIHTYTHMHVDFMLFECTNVPKRICSVGTVYIHTCT